MTVVVDVDDALVVEVVVVVGCIVDVVWLRGDLRALVDMTIDATGNPAGMQPQGHFHRKVALRRIVVIDVERFGGD